MPRILPWGIAAAGLLLHMWAAWGGFFHMDDFFYLADADRPFVEYVFQIYNGHLMPGEFAIVWVSQAIAPMSWTLAFLVMTGLWVLLLVGLVMTLRRLFGDSAWVSIAVAAVALSPLMTTVTVWYASALQILPWAASFIWMIYFASAHAQQPRARWLVLTVVAFVGGLLFWEKSLLALPVVLWLWWRYWPGTGRMGLSGLGRRWWLPGITVAVAAAYSVLYLAVQPEAVLRSEPSMEEMLDSVRISLAEVWLPGYFGAPWTGFSDALAPGTSSAWWLFLLVGEVILALVVISIIRWRPALNAWIVIAGYAGVTVILFVFGRINAFGTVLAYDPRYVEDLFVVGAVVLPFAFVRPAGSPLPTPRQLAWLPAHVPSWAAVGGLAVLVNVLLLPSIAVGSSWQDTPAKEWVSNARASLENRPGLPVLDGKVPEAVMAPLFLERANASYVLAGARLPVTWNGSGPQIYVLDDAGEARPVEVAASSTSVPGFDGDCGYRVFEETTTVELDSTLFEWTWIGRMDYLAAAPTSVQVSLGGTSTVVPLAEGPGAVMFVVVGSGDTLYVTPTDDVGVCVTKVVLGQNGPS